MRERRGKMKSEWNFKYEMSVYNKIQISEKGKMSWERVVNLNFNLGERKGIYNKFNEDVKRVGSSDIGLSFIVSHIGKCVIH